MKKKRILVVSSANIDFVQRMRRVPYSGETVCEVLDISKYTLYKYLEAIRSETDKNQEKGTDCQ